MIFKRNCPKCNKELSYSMEGNYKRAIRRNSVCINCRKMPESLKKTLSEYWSGKKRPNYKRKVNQPVKWIRVCPECKKEIKYKGRFRAYELAEKEKRVCPACITNKREVKWILSRENLNQMAATKAGYSSYEEYQKALPKFAAYKMEVWKITYRQPLQSLPNIDKRGRAGIEGAYQLDHKISMWYGFKNNIPAETIGNIKNLRMIPWLENLKKHKRIA